MRAALYSLLGYALVFTTLCSAQDSNQNNTASNLGPCSFVQQGNTGNTTITNNGSISCPLNVSPQQLEQLTKAITSSSEIP